MPRPSRNIDKILIKAGLELLPDTGIAGLNIREVAQRAQVNLGMFHYHFKTKEVFVRVLMQELYESMFSRIVPLTDDTAPAVENLERIITTLARFAREHHRFLTGMLLDLKTNNPITLEFVMTNFPRHLTLIRQQVERGQREGSIVPLPIPLLISFIASSVIGPQIFGGLITGLELPAVSMLKPLVEKEILSDAAIEQRVRLTLKGVSP